MGRKSKYTDEQIIRALRKSTREPPRRRSAEISAAMKIRTEILEEKARIATREALAHCPDIPRHLRKELVLGADFRDSEVVFTLYIPGVRPEDAVILTQVAVSSVTGEIGPVEVYPERWSDATSDPET